MARMRRSPGARCLQAIWEALVSYGSFWICIPEAPEPGPPLAGPAPHHPERLCPELPLTTVERRLQEELCGRP